MALGAVFLTFPAALLGALWLRVVNDLGAVESLVAYGALGTALMAASVTTGLLAASNRL